jgi:hypothetical protein
VLRWSRNLLQYTDGAIYICMSTKEWPLVSRVLAEEGGHWSDTIIWAKDRFVLGRADYQRQYEPIWYGWREGVPHHWNGDRDQGDVWKVERPSASEAHATQKPLALIERAIENSSKPGHLVTDLFLGSGSSLIACERTGRTCLGIEIDPNYASIVLMRWEAFTGEEGEAGVIPSATYQSVEVRRLEGQIPHLGNLPVPEVHDEGFAKVQPPPISVEVRRLQGDTVLVVGQVGVALEAVVAAGCFHEPSENILELALAFVVSGELVVALDVDLHVVGEHAEEALYVPLRLSLVDRAQYPLIGVRHCLALLSPCGGPTKTVPAAQAIIRPSAHDSLIVSRPGTRKAGALAGLGVDDPAASGCSHLASRGLHRYETLPFPADPLVAGAEEVELAVAPGKAGRPASEAGFNQGRAFRWDAGVVHRSCPQCPVPALRSANLVAGGAEPVDQEFEVADVAPVRREALEVGRRQALELLLDLLQEAKRLGVVLDVGVGRVGGRRLHLGALLPPLFITQTAGERKRSGRASQKNLSLTRLLAIVRRLSDVYGCLFERRAAQHGD